MNFYTIVTIIATIFLIILLTILGIFLSNKTSNQIYPPMMNNCPDYWNYTTDNSGNYVCELNDINIGKFANANGTRNDAILIPNNVPGLTNSIDSTKAIDFKDTGFSTKYNSTQICGLNKWTTINNIAWDGVSNYNGC